MKTTLMICDIQPEYAKYMNFRIADFAQFLNHSIAQRWNKTIYFYNGWDTLGMIAEHELYEWLWYHGVAEQTFEKIEFVDKGYGFLRGPMDNDEDEQAIVNAVKQLIANDFAPTYVNDEEIHYNDCFPIIRQNKNITFVGGGKNECLAELCYVAKAYNCKYNFNRNFIY